SSPVFTMMVRSRASMVRESPSRSFEAPTPPASAVIFIASLSCESVARYWVMRGRLAGQAQPRQHAFRAVHFRKDAADAVRRRSLGGNAPDAADASAKLLRGHVFPKRRARGLRNVFFHQSAAEVVGARLEAGQR